MGGIYAQVNQSNSGSDLVWYRIASSFFVSEFHSEGEDVVAIPRASVVEKTEPVITVLQEESIPIATEEMEGLGKKLYRKNVERKM